jgi:hypothetical protein
MDEAVALCGHVALLHKGKIVEQGAPAEDIEQKCLRFLVLAGVEPGQYLLGMSGCFILSGIAANIAVLTVLFVVVY